MDFSALNDAVLATFGEDQSQPPVTIGGIEVQAIYDSRHFDLADGEAGTSDLITTIAVSSAALPIITDDTVIMVRSGAYRRWETRPDGQGMTIIQLERIV